LAAEQYVFDQASEVIFAGARDSEPLRHMGITTVPDLPAALRKARDKLGERPDVTVLPHAQNDSV